MDDNKNTNSKLSRRQIEVARRNLVSVCRFSVKSLIDKACFSNVDDECEEFINFCAVLEQVFLHRIRPHKTWYGGAEGRYFWDYIRAACRHVPQSCIISIDAIENIRSPAAKGRAFIRCALMEKKLSEYVAAALKQPHITRKHYLEGAIMLSDDSNMLCGILLGLNAIDFSFCLKGQNMDLLGPLAIDFTPFLQFHQSVESVTSDLEEMRELSNSSISSSIMSEDVIDDASWRNKYKNLEHKYKSVCEQKGYLEELVRLRERQVEEISRENQNMDMRIQYIEAEAQRDHLQLENVVLELQEQLGRVKSERQMLQQRLSLLLAMNPPPGARKVTDIQMAEMAGEGLHSVDVMEQHGFVDSTEATVPSRHLQNVQQQDNKSLLSGSSGQFTAKEDTHSMIPLTGSLTDVQIRSADSPLHQASRTGETEVPKIQVDPVQGQADKHQGQGRSESVDRESLPDMEAEYRERPPSQAFPSFTCVDLDTSLERDEEAFAEETLGDPLGIEDQSSLRTIVDENVHQSSNQESQGNGNKADDAETADDIKNSNSNSGGEIGEKSDSGNSDFDIVTDTDKSSSNESSIELAEPLESVKSSNESSIELAEPLESVKSSNESSIELAQPLESVKSSNESSIELAQPLESVKSSNESSIELAQPLESVKSSSEKPLGESTEEEYQQVSSDGAQTDSATEIISEEIPDERLEQRDSSTEDRKELEESAAESSPKAEKQSELKPDSLDSGSSEGEKDWDLLSDSSTNGQSLGTKLEGEKDKGQT